MRTCYNLYNNKKLFINSFRNCFLNCAIFSLALSKENEIFNTNQQVEKECTTTIQDSIVFLWPMSLLFTFIWCQKQIPNKKRENGETPNIMTKVCLRISALFIASSERKKNLQRIEMHKHIKITVSWQYPTHEVEKNCIREQ